MTIRKLYIETVIDNNKINYIIEKRKNTSGIIQNYNKNILTIYRPIKSLFQPGSAQGGTRMMINGKNTITVIQYFK